MDSNYLLPIDKNDSKVSIDRCKKGKSMEHSTSIETNKIDFKFKNHHVASAA